MSVSRVVIAQFCDDVRQEIGNKYSLMGCYGPELIINKLPATLPKLCVQVRVQTPIDRTFSKLVIRAIFNGDVLAELELPPSDLDMMQKKAASEDEGVAIMVMAIFTFSPLVISESCKLQIEAETEDEILKGNSLRLRERTDADPA